MRKIIELVATIYIIQYRYILSIAFYMFPFFVLCYKMSYQINLKRQ